MKLITALILAIGISVAQAQEFTMPNEGGGEIRLTMTQCPDAGRSTWFVAYAYGKSGKAFYGCWFHANGLVHAVWGKGDSRIYESKDFTEVPGTKPSTKKGYEL